MLSCPVSPFIMCCIHASARSTAKYGDCSPPVVYSATLNTSLHQLSGCTVAFLRHCASRPSRKIRPTNCWMSRRSSAGCERSVLRMWIVSGNGGNWHCSQDVNLHLPERACLGRITSPAREPSQRFFCGTGEDFPVRFKARAVTGAIPGMVDIVPTNDAFQVRADGRKQIDSTTFVTVGG